MVASRLRAGWVAMGDSFAATAKEKRDQSDSGLNRLAVASITRTEEPAIGFRIVENGDTRGLKETAVNGRFGHWN